MFVALLLYAGDVTSTSVKWAQTEQALFVTLRGRCRDASATIDEETDGETLVISCSGGGGTVREWLDIPTRAPCLQSSPLAHVVAHEAHVRVAFSQVKLLFSASPRVLRTSKAARGASADALRT